MAQRDHLTDAMRRYVDGDPAAFRTIYEGLAPLVRRCHARWSGQGTAEDLTQLTFLKVHRARASYEAGAAVKPWVMTIARRASIDSLRKRGRGREHLTADGEVPTRGVAPAVEARSVAREVRRAMEDLSAGQRAVVDLHHLQGHGFADVAHLLGIGESAARVRASRARVALRRSLAPPTLA